MRKRMVFWEQLNIYFNYFANVTKQKSYQRKRIFQPRNKANHDGGLVHPKTVRGSDSYNTEEITGHAFEK